MPLLQHSNTPILHHSNTPTLHDSLTPPPRVSPSFTMLAAFVAVSAVAALTLRHLVHCALSLALTFLGLAGLYLQLGAQFIGLAQVLVYVGAVAILIVFAILLTRGTEPGPGRRFSA